MPSFRTAKASCGSAPKTVSTDSMATSSASCATIVATVKPCPTAGSPRWSRVTMDCGSRPMAAAWCFAARSPASSMRPRHCATHPICAAYARWRATGSAGCGSRSRDAGVAIFDLRSNELHRLRHSATQPNSLSDNAVFNIVHLRNGDTLIGTARGLDRLTPPISTSRTFRCRGSSLPRASRCASARSPKHPTASSGWVRIRASADTTRAPPAGASIGSPGGAPGHSTALPDNRIQSLLIDSQGRLWVGMIRGLAWFDSASETFSSYRRDEAEVRSLPDDYIVSLAEDRGGSLWIGTKSGGLAKWNPRTWSFGHVRASAEEGFSDRNITSFAEDKLGRLWIGTFGSGINLLDRSTGRVTPVRHVNGVRSYPERRARHGDARRQRGRRVGRHDGRRAQPLRPADLEGRGLPARSRCSHVPRPPPA